MKNAPQRIFLTSHINCDPDGLCSAAALASYLCRVFPKIEIKLFFDTVSKLSKNIAKELEITYENRPTTIPDLWIITDTAQPSQLGTLETDIVDHSQVIASRYLRR